jgi:DNA-directed RNA polymerase specialized sigma24 family protein
VASANQQGLWVLRAQCGDREALELLLRDVQPALRRYLCGIVGTSDADDVLQEVLVLIYRKLSGLRTPEAFQGWAFRIATHCGFHHAKSRQRLAYGLAKLREQLGERRNG